MSITSEEVNYLVYRYLLESGFTHSTFAFQQEAAIHTREYHNHYAGNHSAHAVPNHHRQDEIRGSRVPPGALIAFLQKGLQYLEVELHANEDGTEKRCGAPFSLVYPHECEDGDGAMAEVREEKPVVSGSKKNKRDEASGAGSNKREKKDTKKGSASEREKRSRKESAILDTAGTALAGKQSQNGPSNASGEVKSDQAMQGVEPTLDASDVTILEGHESEVFVCSWNPKYMLIASGSADGTARIWKLTAEAKDVSSDCIILHHSSPQEGSKCNTLDWNPLGTLLATGSYDGEARIWTKAGDQKHLMKKHEGPIFSLKWNKKGDLLLSGSMDKTAIVWDAVSGESRQQFAFHEAPTLDVDWKDDITFATCSTDKCIYVCRLGTLEPIRAFQGMRFDEVNAIKWDPSGMYLASCADDKTAKVWTLDSDSPLHDFTGHTKEIYSARWSPGQASSAKKLLATASWDSTIRIWDVTVGSLLFVLEEHTAPIYSVSFSPDGMFLASGGFDQVLNIWRVKDGALLRSYNGSAGIFEVGWGGKGDKVSASFSDGTLALIYLPHLRDKT
ncbi:WD40-repeat-containing domain protein [Chytridium lagenaria]|nr:WD40-repeat-containing domain protein [Chytridium lagenaria]